MNATDVIVIIVLAIILCASAAYVYKAKKKGKKCIGCPYCDSCSSKNCGK